MNEILLRTATIDDSEFFYNLRNEYTVRMNSFNAEVIPYEKHFKWFKGKVSEKSTILLIACIETNPIGQIRIDLEDNFGIISYSILKEFRGQGLGTKILELIKEYIKTNKYHCKRLIGNIKIENIASAKAFQKAGYVKISDNDEVLKYEIIL